jgi:hypothetical protein
MNVIERLDWVVNQQWEEIKTGPFFQTARKQLSLSLYIRVMEQIYHYTKHNSINQATAAFKTDPQDTKLLRFVYKHALEELGHEKMVEHDLKSIGHKIDLSLVTPAPATEGLIAYLYYVGLTQGAGPRLGYSFWAEDAYQHIAPLLNACRTDLKLTDKNMTFFVSHAEIDTQHAKEVKEAILRWCDTPEKEDQIIRVAKNSLYLTGEILNSAAKYEGS